MKDKTIGEKEEKTMVYAFRDGPRLVIIVEGANPEEEKEIMEKIRAVPCEDSCALPPEPLKEHRTASDIPREEPSPFAVETVRKMIAQEGDAAYSRYLTAYKTGEIKEGRSDVKKLLQAARIIRLARITPDEYVAMEKDARALFWKLYISDADKAEFKRCGQEKTQKAMIAYLSAKYMAKAEELGLLRP